MNSKGLLKLVLALVVIVAIGVGLGWLASHRSTPNPAPIAPVIGNTPEATSHSTAATTAPQPAGETATEPVPMNIAPAEVAADKSWDDKIGDILGDDNSEITNKVEEFLKLYPSLPPEGKLEVVEHLNNLVDDDSYAPLAKIAADPKTPPLVSKSILDDLMNRPNSIHMPLALAIARNPQHPNAAAAKEDMEMFLEEDHGEDWDAWEKEMNQWLKDNPD